MRAIRYERYGDAGVLGLADVAVPEIEDDEVLIRVRAASINPFDWKLRSGLLRDVMPVEFPVTPGRDGCGTVVQAGSHAADGGGQPFAEGDRVAFIGSRLVAGTLAEFVAVRAADNVVRTDGRLDPFEAAALPLCGLSAWNAVVDAGQAQSGMHVLVHGGAGGVGSLAIQVARHLGADVSATCRRAKCDFVAALGAAPVPYDEVDFAEAVAGVDVVIDTVGGDVHDRSYRVLNRGGRIAYLLARPITDRSAEYGVRTVQARIFGNTANLARVVALAEEGGIRPAVGHVAPLADARAAFGIAESGEVAGKVVVDLQA